MSKSDRGQTPTWLRFSGIGVEFAAVIVVFTLVGLWIDRGYDKSPWGVVIGSSLGLIIGMYNLIRESLKASRDAAVRDRKPESDGVRSHEP